MRYLTELICNLYRLTDHHKLTTATFKNLADIKYLNLQQMQTPYCSLKIYLANTH